MSPSLIVCAGPAGGGKSTQARRLHDELEHVIVATDDYIEEGWTKVPKVVKRVVEALERPCILEGVRALSCIYHNKWLGIVSVIWWCDHGPGKPNCEALLQRQKDLIALMQAQRLMKRPGKFEQ